jgi:hypothetical protein
LLEEKTEIRMVGHILEREIIFKLSEKLKDVDVEVMHVEVSFAALKAGVEERMPSFMRFFLVGSKAERDRGVEIVKKLAEENGMDIDYIKERVD